MMRLVLLTTFLLGTLFGCWPERHRWNQRMTVTVETPEGVVSASSVIEVRAEYYEGGELLTGTEVRYRYTGEAVALEVRPGRWLFALIDNPAELMYRASPDRFGGIPRHDRGAWLAAIPEQTEAVELTGGWRPRLVTFEDVTVPATVTAVDPDDLAATFGEGVRLLSVLLEVTDQEHSTESVADALPWLCEYLDPYRRLNGQSGPIRGNTLPETLGPGAFSIGVCR